MANIDLTIVCGGQTGADRAALDTALALGIPCGGWCPEGRKAEDGIIPAQYPVLELPGSNYAQRTQANVHDSDGSVVFYFRTPTSGTELSIKYCIETPRPYLLVDVFELTTVRAIARIGEFIEVTGAKRLNVAGPRESKVPAMYEYVRETLFAALQEDN